MNVEIIKFETLSASEETWNIYFDHIDPIRYERDPDDTLLPREKRKNLNIAFVSNPEINVCKWILKPKDKFDKIIGLFSIYTTSKESSTYEKNKHIGRISVSITKNYRRRGYGTLLFEHALKEVKIKEPSIREITSTVTLDSGRQFLEKRGGKIVLESSENRLYLNNVDWKMIKTWAEDGEKNNPSSKTKIVTTIPGELIEDYSNVYTETANGQPLGEIQIDIRYTPEAIRRDEKSIKKNDITQFTMLSIEKDQKITGITEIFFQKDAPHKLSQNLTGVPFKYRGRGLGKLLKAKMLLFVKEKYPNVKYIETGNSNTNLPMLNINERLGFKKHIHIYIYKIKL